MDWFMDLFADYGLFLGIPLVFLGIVAWIYRPGAKRRYQADAELPFRGNDKDEQP